MPPIAEQLRRFMGTEPKQKKTSAQDVMREAAKAGMAVMEGRPDDPMLEFLNL